MQFSVVRTVVAASFLFGATPAGAESKLTVVELFTSQGCPLCPAADAYLAELAERDDILALSFHVDYWDFIGWKDTLADPSYTRRQQSYADGFGLPYVFTPQMVINGVWQGSGSDNVAVSNEIATVDHPADHQARIDLRLESDNRILVRLEKTAYSGEAEVLLARYDSETVTDITRGENGGQRLRGVNVVRDLHSIAVWRGEALEFSFPLEDLKGVGEDFYAVIVQETRQGEILAAAYLDLR